MAFERAAGYNNLPNGYFVPAIYSQKVLKYFRKTSVVEEITNSDYYGEIANFGDTVYVINEPTVSVSPYQRGITTQTQDLTDSQLTLTVDKANYFQFAVDDLEKKQSHVNWLDMATSAAAYELKDEFDTEVLSYMYSQVPTANKYGTAGSPTDLGFGSGEISPLTVMNRLNRLMDVNNVPTDNRWFVAGPLFWEQMADENSKLMDIGYMAPGTSEVSAVRNGLLVGGKPIRGFKCYTSNNMPSDTHNVAMAGHMSSTAQVSQIASTEVIRSEKTFADIVRGLHLYGRKVLRTNAIYASVYQID